MSLDAAITQLVAVFHKYSGREGDKYTLTKAELKELLKAEFQLGKNIDQQEVDAIFKDLDSNADGTVDFQEYVTLVVSLAMTSNDFLKGQKKK